MRKITIIVVLIAAALLLSGCKDSLIGSGIAQQSTATPTPTVSGEPGDGEEKQKVFPTVTPTPTVAAGQPTPMPTSTIVSAKQPEGCPQARDLGPWAPTGSGEGITFEVTASDTSASNLSSAGVVLGLWWPNGKPSWGVKEITTFVPRGLSITVINGAGRGWDYEFRCDSATIKGELDAHMAARKLDTSYFGFVSVEELVRTGLIEIRFDRRNNQPSISPTTGGNPTAVSPAVAPTTCKATRKGNSDDVTSLTANNTTYVVEAWGNNIDGFVVIPSGETIPRAWKGGALWDYACIDTNSVIKDVSGRNKPVYVVKNGKLVKQ